MITRDDFLRGEDLGTDMGNTIALVDDASEITAAS